MEERKGTRVEKRVAWTKCVIYIPCAAAAAFLTILNNQSIILTLSSSFLLLIQSSGE